MDEAYSNLRIEKAKALRYVPCTVISRDPEGDAIAHIKAWAAQQGILEAEIIGWDFPHVSQEQVNGYSRKCGKDGTPVTCYEKVYRSGEAECMDIFIAVEG